MEALGRMVETVVGGGFLSAFSVGNAINASITLSHFSLQMILSFFATHIVEIFNL